MKEPKISVQIKVSKELHRKAKVALAKKGVSFQEVVIKLLEKIAKDES